MKEDRTPWMFLQERAPIERQFRADMPEPAKPTTLRHAIVLSLHLLPAQNHAQEAFESFSQEPGY
jgi:hypothetical protein